MTHDSEQLANLIDTRFECVHELHTLGKRQLENIASGDFAQLLRILAGKQRLLARLQEIERQLDPFRRQEPQSRYWTSADERKRCAFVASECERLLREIVTQEQQSEQQLALRRNHAAAELHAVDSASQARGAYATATTLVTNQLDLSCES